MTKRNTSPMIVLTLILALATPIAMADLTDNVVLVWELENSSLPHDVTGNDLHGTATGSPAFNIGGGFNISGTGSAATGGNFFYTSDLTTYIKTGKDYCIELWADFNPWTSATGYGVLAFAQNGATDPYLFVQTATTNTKFRIADGSSAAEDAYNVEGGSLKQYVWCYSNGQMNSSISGTYKHTFTNVMAGTNAQQFVMGANNINGAYSEGGTHTYYRLAIWNRSLTQEEITELNNSGTILRYTSWGGATPTQKINLITQSPANVTITNLLDQQLNITYNYTNNPSWTSPQLNYSITSDYLSCIQYLNGSCALANNTYRTDNPSLQLNGTNYTQATYTLGENDAYTKNDNLNYTSFATTHTAHDLTTSFYMISTEFLNITQSHYQILEIMANSTASSLVYTCNSNYTTGSVITSPWCQEIGRINSTIYNHTHTGGYSSHNLIPFTISNNKINGGIYATPTMRFIIRGSSTGLTQAWHVPTNSRTGATKTSINNGVTWTDQTYTLDAHLHFYNNTENLNYHALGNNGSEIINSTWTTEKIDLIPLSPSPPVITSPLDTTQATRYLNITWTASTAQTPSATITGYTINLLNPSLTYNHTLNTTTGLSYYLDVYALNLSINTWHIQVIANDSNGLTSQDIEDFNLTRNTIYNVTFVNAINSTYLTNNGTAIILNLNNSDSESANITNGKLDINLIKGYAYNFSIDMAGYALTNHTLTADQTNISKAVNLSLFTNNSIYIYIYDESSGFLISGENITITITGIAEQVVYTTTGTYYIDNLADGEYTLKFESTNYSLKQYTASVGSRSTQTLNAFLSTSTQTSTFTIQDFDSGSVIEGATFTQSRLINGTWTIVNTKTSDITGRAQITYLPNVKYRFVASKTGYNTNTFDLDPVIFSTYSVRLTKVTTFTELSTPAYTDVSINFYPINFTANTTHTFYYYITSPAGQLLNYNLSINYTSGTTYSSGSNLYGETFTEVFAIPSTNFTDRISIVYCYQTTTSVSRCNKAIYPIFGSIGNYTFYGNIKKTYNMGILDRTIIATLIMIFVVGFVFAYVGLLAGTITATFMMGYLYYIGLLSLWLILPSILIGILIAMRGRDQ